MQLSAWLSLWSQLPVLIGPHGLLPAERLFARARQHDLSFFELPSLLWIASDLTALNILAGIGTAAATAALAGWRPRVCAAVCAVSYGSFTNAASTFTAFQWDNLLVETSLLAACLPHDRAAPLSHFAFRALLFKLYFESGIAKWQSHLGDWHDGSAMTYYFETAPIPTALAYHAHGLPRSLLQLCSWGALVLELVVPFLIWGPRAARLAAFVALSAFQLLNTLTANYGFFTYLALSLHVFLLCDRDVERLLDTLHLRPRSSGKMTVARARRYVGPAALAGWLALSTIGASLSFSGPSAQPLTALYRAVAPFRIANVYHLFGHITRVRIEPQLETRSAGDWREHHMHYKPGPVDRAPPYVAPHQPRVDFRLWFYGLSFQRGTPRYVDRLLERLCDDPASVQSLFETTLPARPDAVRIAFYRYRFADREAHERSGVYWQRRLLGRSRARRCSQEATR